MNIIDTTKKKNVIKTKSEWIQLEVGNIVGEHTVQFFGEFETLEIKHTSYSRNVFAEGAIKAAQFIVEQKPGLYDMNDLSQI